MTSYRRAYRPADHRLVGGVATGLAEHLGVPVVYVRVAFVVATWFQGVGVLAYLLLWRLLPLRRPEMSPGLESATRRGLRGGAGGVRGSAREAVQTVALGAVGIGVLLLIQSTGRGIDDGLFAPLLVGIVGVAVVWRQLDDVTWARWMRQTSGWAFASRVAAGLGLIAVAAIYFLTKEGGWGAAVNLASALVIAVLGLGLILGPWIARLSGDLSEERRERVRSQERADVAAHLHDSVLQTLALIQKNAGDSAAVSQLARSQERDLRSWLYAGERADETTVARALRRMAAEIEDAHGVSVDVVNVGDTELTEDLHPIVSAAREAVTNAAKHAGVPRVDVYAEIGDPLTEVFVRDRGAGFDTSVEAPAERPGHRLGIRNSIIDRMARHGGSADIRSTPGEGTEVRLSLSKKESS